MGRIYSGKPVSDIETSAESIIPRSLTGSTLKKKNEAAAKLTVSASLQSERQIDEFGGKKQ
ncbi:MAG: hypothetical protein PHV32_15325 [Eubacteriales bacterium]|nr:hypothetical protein [Eubacteriales bacterium]